MKVVYKAHRMMRIHEIPLMHAFRTCGGNVYIRTEAPDSEGAMPDRAIWGLKVDGPSPSVGYAAVGALVGWHTGNAEVTYLGEPTIVIGEEIER